MNYLFLGISVLSFPFIMESRIDRENRIKLNLLKNIYKKYQLLDDSTDVSKLSEDYAVVVLKKIENNEEIIDHEMGLSFKGIMGLTRNIKIAESFGDEKTIQVAKYRGTTNEELKKMTNGKFSLSNFEVKGQHLSIRNIILRKNFILENYKRLSIANLNSPKLISNPKDINGKFQLIENPENKSDYLNDKFIDYDSVGNNIYIQSNKNKLTKGDLKIEYITYSQADFLLIGCIDNEKFLTNSKNVSQQNTNDLLNKDKNSINIKPAFRYGATDYMIIPFKIQDIRNAKEEVDRFFVSEIEKLEISPTKKRIKKYIAHIGLVLFGYGFLKISFRFFSWRGLLGIILKFAGL
jgi:hypothetical protein